MSGKRNTRLGLLVTAILVSGCAGEPAPTAANPSPEAPVALQRLAVTTPTRTTGNQLLASFEARENARVRLEAASREVNVALADLRAQAPDVLKALETAGQTTLSHGVEEGTLVIVRTIVGKSSHSALNGVLKVTSKLSAVFTAIDIARLLVINVKLVTANVRANWTILTKLKPAAAAFETADAQFVAALRAQPWTNAQTTLSYTLSSTASNPRTISDICRPNFSGAASVQLRAAVGLSLSVVRWEQSVACTNGRYTISISNQAGLRKGYSAFFLALRNGNTDTFVTPVYLN